MFEIDRSVFKAIGESVHFDPLVDIRHPELVRIGAHSIVGAGAVVTRDVEPYSVVGGTPARLIRKRDDP